MQRKFITNLALLIFLNLLVKPFWIFGIDRSVQNAVGAGEYGSYFALLNFTFIFNILLDLGITNFNNRNIARHQQLLHKHFSGIVSLRIVLALLYLGVKGIRLGPTLPAFLSPAVAKVLVEKFDLKPIGTVTDDVAAMMKGQ